MAFPSGTVARITFAPPNLLSSSTTFWVDASEKEKEKV
jgi:hypothetical protein